MNLNLSQLFLTVLSKAVDRDLNSYILMLRNFVLAKINEGDKDIVADGTSPVLETLCSVLAPVVAPYDQPDFGSLPSFRAVYKLVDLPTPN